MLIGLAGAIGAGKDTVADYLARNYVFKHYKMAGKLKRMLEVLFDLPNDWSWEGDKQSPNELLYGYSKRQVLQWYGTDGFPPKLRVVLEKTKQYIVPELYKVLFGRTRGEIMSDAHSYGYNFYVMDVVMLIGGFRKYIDQRFWADNIFRSATVNDVDYFVKNNNIVISDVRFPEELEDPVKKYGCLVYIQGNEDISKSMNHASEQHLSNLREQADYVLVNDGSIEYLYRKVDGLIIQMLDI